MKNFLAEFVGTFVLIFLGCGSIMVSQHFPGSIGPTGISIIFGVAVSLVIYLVGPISGAHINPAVTLALFFSGHFPRSKILGYFLAQLSGAVAGVLVLSKLLPGGKGLGGTHFEIAPGQAFVWELAMTFLLMSVVIVMINHSRFFGRLAGILIGAAVTLDALVGGPATGASMNPARSIAPALFERRLEYLWIYLVAPMVGALAAVWFYKWIKNIIAIEVVNPLRS